MPNPYAGEVAITLNGTPVTMRLTLGALVELEQILAVGGLVELVQRFETGRYSSRDILAVLLAGLRGAGWSGTDQDLASAHIDGGAIAAAQAAAQVLALAFGTGHD